MGRFALLLATRYTFLPDSLLALRGVDEITLRVTIAKKRWHKCKEAWVRASSAT
jgi:hypothetical protein